MELIRLKGIDNHRCGEWCRRVFEFGSPLFGHRFGFLADHNPRMYRDIGCDGSWEEPNPPTCVPTSAEHKQTKQLNRSLRSSIHGLPRHWHAASHARHFEYLGFGKGDQMGQKLFGICTVPKK